MTLITQRSSVINKNVLTQTECLIVFQMTSPQDRDSIDEWIRQHGDEDGGRHYSTCAGKWEKYVKAKPARRPYRARKARK